MSAKRLGVLGTSLLLCLAACSSKGVDEAGGISEVEAQALEKAAQMLEDPRLNDTAHPSAGTAPQAPGAQSKEAPMRGASERRQ